MKKAAWQTEHLPNLTGTKYAHKPKGHILKGGKRAAATGDYEVGGLKRADKRYKW